MTIVLALSMVVNVSVAGKTVIELRPRATVTGRAIRIGDIAIVTGPDDGICGEISSLYVGRVPPPDRSVTIRRLQVLHSLAGKGYSTGEVSLCGEEGVVVRGTWRRIPSSEISAVAKKALDDLVEGKGWEIRYFLTSRIGDLWVPGERYELHASRPDGPDLKRTVAVRVDAMVDGESAEGTVVCFGVTIFDEVVVADRDIERHCVIEKNHVRLEKREITGMAKRVLFSLDGVLGKRARRSIHQGEWLLRELVEPPPDIERGTPLRVLASRGSVAISMPGRALEDGRIGEEIKVMVETTRKRLRGRLLDNETVAVPL